MITLHNGKMLNQNLRPVKAHNKTVAQDSLISDSVVC